MRRKVMQPSRFRVSSEVTMLAPSTFIRKEPRRKSLRILCLLRGSNTRENQHR